MNYMLRLCAAILFCSSFLMVRPMMMFRRVADTMKNKKNAVYLKPVVLFHRIWSIEEGLGYLEHGISKIPVDVWNIEELNKGIDCEYIDPKKIQEDSVHKGIFWKEGFFGGNDLYVGIKAFQHNTIVYNAKISKSFDLCKQNTIQGEHEKSKMPLDVYLEKEARGKRMAKSSKKIVTYDKITAEPTTMYRLYNIGYRPAIALESPIPADKLVGGKAANTKQ